VGGIAEYLAFPESVGELRQLVFEAKTVGIPITTLGRLSNVIVKDTGISGLVLILDKLKSIEVSDNKITAMAGDDVILLSEKAYESGLTGLEWAAGIPGSVGGAVYMNAGAYDGEISQLVFSVEVLEIDSGDNKIYQTDALEFGYRDSVVQHSREIILSATFELESGDREVIRATMDDFNYRRADKQPLEYPSNGSVFKRPVGYYAGKLIMDSDLMGYTVGGAQISNKHANFIVNINQAQAQDYLDIIQHVKEAVSEKFDIEMVPEVKILGD
jgi:UDP-N-acetylmuramate dehydrogenase